MHAAVYQQEYLPNQFPASALCPASEDVEKSITENFLFCRPMDFENINVLHQLRCGGVLEAVRISCAGYPTKTPYEDFVDHFWNLVPELLSNQELDDVALSKAVLKKANLVGYQCGQTKVRGCPVCGPHVHQALSERACRCQSVLSCVRLTVVRKRRDSRCNCTAMSQAHPCGSSHTQRWAQQKQPAPNTYAASSAGLR